MSTDQQTVTSYTQGAEEYNRVQPNSFYHKYVEKPAMLSLLPDLQGKKVLCIGVGTGQEAKELSDRGASVVGIDISEGMINQARKNFPGIEFLVKDMMNHDFEADTFDLVYSSLALHYAEDLPALFRNIWRVIKPEGILLFSTTHPIFDSVVDIDSEEKELHVIGHSKNKKTKEIGVLGDYFTEEKRTQDWGNNFVVKIFGILTRRRGGS